MNDFLILSIFCVGYLAIMFEYSIRINKTAAALVTGVICWTVYFLSGRAPIDQSVTVLSSNVAQIAEILFFLLGSMTLVELIDSHKGFKVVTDLIRTTSQRKMLWLVAFATFFLSALLDNLTTTILMISLLRKLIPDPKERLQFSILIVTAANAGGAWTPIGDVTTTMLWINGSLSSLAVMKALLLPSLISLLIPVIIFGWNMKKKLSVRPAEKEEKEEPGARLVFICGILALIFVPVFKTLTGLPPYMGVLIALGVLWLVTDLLHHKHETRAHLRVPHILTKIDTASILFFLGILLCVDALSAIGFLNQLATWLSQQIGNLSLIATTIGFLSAVIDNVPLVAAAMEMYPLSQYPLDHTLWHLIAYTAGTGGSLLLIGSSSGVALMGMEKVHFFTYMKKATIPVLLGYLAGIILYAVF
jgi:Na+/H+ antiporter NhaD/arsenite permease-like protein